LVTWGSTEEDTGVTITAEQQDGVRAALLLGENERVVPRGDMSKACRTQSLSEVLRSVLSDGKRGSERHHAREMPRHVLSDRCEHELVEVVSFTNSCGTDAFCVRREGLHEGSGPGGDIKRHLIL
jgi:hypothetical protein